MTLISTMHTMLMVQSGTSIAQIASGSAGNKYVLFGSIALNVVLLAALIFWVNGLKLKVAKLKKNRERLGQDLLTRENVINSLKVENSRLSAEQRRLTEMHIKTQISETGSEDDNSVTVELSVENTNVDTKEYKNEVNSVPSSLNESRQTFYASCEQENEIGYLIIENRKSHQTPYQIQLIDGKYSFVLDSLNREALQNAINFYNIYIRPFCSSSNLFQDHYTSFVTEQNAIGILEKEGDKFRVVEKLKIKFLEA